ncbi:cbb3-type cytochrome c oxidase subunit 3 [Pseudomonas chlororaphis]|uniref:cbb3-type cytochrome c oxidase subunit 3 n=1 Tax=Pseudomonas chlororaphis TaxID=587753 RepID=UPI0039E22587
MIEFALDLLGVTFLYLSIGYCLRHQSAKSLEDASLIPFADDPDVARRVELATGKKIDAVAPEPTEVRPGWGNVEI